MLMGGKSREGSLGGLEKRIIHSEVSEEAGKDEVQNSWLALKIRRNIFWTLQWWKGNCVDESVVTIVLLNMILLYIWFYIDT